MNDYHPLNKGQCWCVSVWLSVLYRNPNGWMDQDEIWNRGGPRGGGGFHPILPTTQVQVLKGGPGCLWSLSHAFWQNFIKQKLQGAPDLVGVSHLFGPNSGSGRTWAPCSVAMVSHYEREYIKSKLHDMFLIAIWLGLTPYSLTSRVQGGPVGYLSLSGAFWQKLYKTKVAGQPQLSGGRSPFWTTNLDLAIPTQLSHQTKPYNFNNIFKTSFQSSWATTGNPS